MRAIKLYYKMTVLISLALKKNILTQCLDKKGNGLPFRRSFRVSSGTSLPN